MSDFFREKMMRPEFLVKCESWRKRVTETQLYSDIYDGKVWQDFLEHAFFLFLLILL